MDFQNLKVSIRRISNTALEKCKPSKAQSISWFEEIWDLECAALRIVLMAIELTPNGQYQKQSFYECLGIFELVDQKILFEITESCRWKPSGLLQSSNSRLIHFIGSREISLKNLLRPKARLSWQNGALLNLVDSNPSMLKDLANWPKLASSFKMIIDHHEKLRLKIFRAYRYTALRSLSSFSTEWRFIDDIYQEGQIGVIDAVDRFDPSQGTNFENFASNTAYWYISRNIGSVSRLVRIPAHIEKNLAELKKSFRESASSNFYDFFFRNVAENELSFVALLVQPTSLEELKAFSAEKFFGAINQNALDSLDDVFDDAKLRLLINQALKGEKQRNKVLFWEYYGENSSTLEAVGERHSLTRERVRQVIGKILERCERRAGKMSSFYLKPSRHLVNVHQFFSDYNSVFFPLELEPDNYFSVEAIFLREFISDELNAYYSHRPSKTGQKKVKEQEFINPEILNLLKGLGGNAN